MTHRIEKDALGSVKVPKDAYYGSFTARALQNFQISGITAPKEFRIAIGNVKKAAAQTNHQLGELSTPHANAIIKAADEFINGKFDTEFTIDIFQAGAGTPYNMNCNEILANRSNELLKRKKGQYDPITPNNHINWGQSSNDVIPASIKIAALLKLSSLKQSLNQVTTEFDKKALQYKHTLKIGRTHLQDAVPITLGQELAAYSSALKKDLKLIKDSFETLKTVGIGGTAIGTGITAHPKYQKLMITNLSKLLNIQLKPATSLVEITHNMTTFAQASSSLRMLANNLIRITGDLRILNSGPAGAINEITLPEVEPGSSIMPGKVNPSIPECLCMISYQVIGNDSAINGGVQSGQLELNVMTPMIMHNLLWSMDILTNGLNMFASQCISGLKANEDRCQTLLDQSLCFATGLSAYIGYKKTAELVAEAKNKNQTLKQTLLKNKIMSESELDQTLSIENIIKPTLINKKLKDKIRKNLPKT